MSLGRAEQGSSSPEKSSSQAGMWFLVQMGINVPSEKETFRFLNSASGHFEAAEIYNIYSHFLFMTCTKYSLLE